MIMISLPQKTINGVPVIVNIVPKGNYKVRPALAMPNPKTIAIHNTGNKSKGADAKAHNKLLHNNVEKGDASPWASYQFVVDENSIYQNIPLNESAWHTGDGSGVNSGNRTAIGIEICEHADQKSYAKAEANAVHLVVALMKAFGLGISAVKPHQAYSGKYCPHIILSRSGGFATFTNAVNRAKAGNEIVVKDDGSHVSPNTPSNDRVDDSYKGKRVESIHNGDLNFYSRASWDSKYRVGTLKKGYGFPTIVRKVKVGTAYQYEVKNSKGATFYITASPTYVKVEGEAKPVAKPKPKPKPKPSGIKAVGNIVLDGVNNFTYIYSSTKATTKLGKANKNAKYPIAGSTSEFYEIIYNGKRAYIKAKYCSRI
jgi:N-acetylmuramoyl-L-alanine amidase CwlA